MQSGLKKMYLIAGLQEFLPGKMANLKVAGTIYIVPTTFFLRTTCDELRLSKTKSADIGSPTNSFETSPQRNLL